ncbi:MAG: Patatin [Anaerocolumna sp.]|jgi:NTE family protein|nr:Patatin [Anaerocolumna sp.]
MGNNFDLSKEYGLVLEGGGAKGAYQIGVWKALLELGVKIKGVSGVSVGALNGALMCMGDYKQAEELWKDLNYSAIMNVDNNQMDKLIGHHLKDINFNELRKDAMRFLKDKGIDVTPLKELIDKWVDEDKIRSSDIEFIFGTFLVSKLKEVEICSKELENENLKDYLLASASLPTFRNERLNGLKYLDGGMFNNVPIDMLINRGYKNIIVIRIYGIGLAKPIKIPKDVNLIEIAPRINLGGLLEFNKDKIRRNINVGYCDGLRCLRSLEGKIYYIDNNLTEEECANKFIQTNEAVKMALLEYYKQDYTDGELYTRKFMEAVCPSLASTLNLKKEWSYRELYLSLLELCAKSLKLSKYRIYTSEELKAAITIRYQHVTLRGYQFPIFHQLILKMMSI